MSGKNKDSAAVNFNPLKVFVISLCVAFFLGEIYNFYLPLHLAFKFFGFFIIFFCIILFTYCVRIFLHHKESLPPSSPTHKIIKTGIYLYTRNPIYICFVCFQFGMFMLFGNFSDLLVGFFGGLDIVVDPFTHSKSGTVRIVALQSCDIAVRHAVSFCKST